MKGFCCQERVSHSKKMHYNTIIALNLSSHQFSNSSWEELEQLIYHPSTFSFRPAYPEGSASPWTLSQCQEQVRLVGVAGSVFHKQSQCFLRISYSSLLFRLHWGAWFQTAPWMHTVDRGLERWQCWHLRERLSHPVNGQSNWSPRATHSTGVMHAIPWVISKWRSLVMTRNPTYQPW